MLLGRVEEAPLALLEYPGIGSPIRHSGLRKWPVHKAPFILVYADRGVTVEVRRVLHVASDWLGLFP